MSPGRQLWGAGDSGGLQAGALRRSAAKGVHRELREQEPSVHQPSPDDEGAD